MTVSYRFARFLPVTMIVSALLCVMLWSSPATAACSPPAPIRIKLESMKRDKWQLPDDSMRQKLAVDLLDCLGAPDPVLRDELAFEALSQWMRGKQLTPETLRTINGKLQVVLDDGTSETGELANPTGFLQPFAVLTLAEVARADRVQAFLTEMELEAMVSAGTKYLSNVRDYRGYIEGEGWRHGVAHAADLMLQLSLNSRLSRPQLDRVLAAVASQITPSGEHFYRYHEGERLMAPVFYIARRELYQATDWNAWIAALMLPTKPKPPVSQTTLAQRHNLAGFLLPLYFSLQESGDAKQRERLLPAVSKALREID